MASPYTRFVPPQPFTRVANPSGLLPSYYQRPHDPSVRRQRDLALLLSLLPWRLTPALSKRFSLDRRPFVWSAPPTRASFARDVYASGAFADLKDGQLCSAITMTGGLIEWLLEAPEDAVGGLNRTYLLLVQKQRLLQLWEEVQRRHWSQGSLKTFEQALG